MSCRECGSPFPGSHYGDCRVACGLPPTAPLAQTAEPKPPSVADEARKLDALARRVAATRKERQLRRSPMMDEFAVRLNREPTWEEVEFAKTFILDVRAAEAHST